MPQSDIDKILAEVRKRKEQSQNTPAAEKAAPVQQAVAVKKTEQQPAILPEPENRMSEKDKNTLSRFINSSAKDEKDDELDARFEDTEYVSKKSEDYIDENFMKFFTQSVIVTKSPEETSELQVKRKKNSFFKRKYITDSLSLNIENLEAEEESKKRRKVRKEEITKDMPIVKTAGDVYAQTLDTPKEEVPVKPAKQAVQEKPAEKPKVATPSSSLNSILGNDKDPESLAKRILEQRRKSQAQAEPARKEKQEITKEIVKLSSEQKAEEADTAKSDVKTPAGDGGIISSIYTAVIETQAQEALAADEMTGFIPEFEDDAGADETVETSVVKAVPEAEEESEEVFEEYIVQSEFFDKDDDESMDIVDELIEFRQTLSMRMIVGFVCGGVLAYLNMAAAGGWPVPAFIAPDAQPLLFYIACTVIYAIAFVAFLPTVLSGFTSVRNAPAPDSLVSLGTVLALVQLMVMVVFSKSITPAEVTIFGAFVCLALAFNAMGKKIATNIIIKNLTLANVPDGINAGYIVNDADAVKRLARTLDEKVPKVLVSRKTDAITNFVQAGFSIHNSDYTARKLAIASWVVTAVCFVLGFVVSKNFATAVFCAAGAAALQITL